MTKSPLAAEVAIALGRFIRSHPSLVLIDVTENLVTLEDADRRRFMLTVTETTSPDITPLPEFDDDGDDDESPADGESFDGGFGNGSYFQHAMQKDD